MFGARNNSIFNNSIIRICYIIIVLSVSEFDRDYSFQFVFQTCYNWLTIYDFSMIV